MLEFKDSLKDADPADPMHSLVGRGDICEGCGQRIRDRWLLKVGETPWHEDCLNCCICRCPLSHSCYWRNNKLYCKHDYDRIFGVKCGRCAERVLPQELVMRAANQVFHLACFVCTACLTPLQKGEQFILRGSQIYCRADFEKELYLIQQQGLGGGGGGGSGVGGGGSSPSRSDVGDVGIIGDENSRPRDGRRGPKRPRTILTSAQRRQFKASFEISPKPCRKVREALAKDTGLSVRVVQVWFQNQRAKMKKLQRKAKQGGGGSGGGGGGDGDGKGDKEGKGGEKEEKGKSDTGSSSEPSGHGNYFGEGDDPFTPGGGSQPLNPNMPYSPEAESFCSSELSLDDSTTGGLENLDDSGPELHNIESNPPHHVGGGGSHSHHHSSHHHHHHHHTSSTSSNTPGGGGGGGGGGAGDGHHHHSSGSSGGSVLPSYNQINPIDKLYLMQNSYFSDS